MAYVNCSNYTYFPTVTKVESTPINMPSCIFNQNAKLVDFVMGQHPILDNSSTQRLVQDLGICQVPDVASYVNWRLKHSTNSFIRNDLATAHIINDTCQLGLQLAPNPPPIKLIDQLVRI